MTKKKESEKPTPLALLSRDQIVRKKFGTFYFGYQTSALESAIESGELPRPFPLSAKGRAQAWTGDQILDHIEKMKALAAERAEAKRAKGKNPQPAGLARKVKKVRLHPPADVEKRRA